MYDDMHDWVAANENMAKVLAARGYRYQFVFAKNAGHGNRPTKMQTAARGARVAVEVTRGAKCDTRGAII